MSQIKGFDRMVLKGIIFLEKVRDNRNAAPHDRGFISYLKRKIKPHKTIPNRKISIFLNRYCNLNCYSCAALGMNPKPDETSIEDIELFLIQMNNLLPGSTVMITGGEPTMSPQLEQVTQLIRENGFKSAMLTNCFKFVPLDWFDFIILDYHGINEGEFELWREALTNSGRWWDLRMKHMHQDIPYAMENNITKGARCLNWLTNYTLWKDIIYPCCNMMCVEWWNETDEATLALREAGWTVHNPDLVETIKNWRETLPAEVYRLCTLKCWKHSSRSKWVDIA